jgi:hypothetical protein
MELLKFLLGDVNSKSILKLKATQEFFDKVSDYINENPGLFAGISREDSDILLSNSPRHSKAKPLTPKDITRE